MSSTGAELAANILLAIAATLTATLIIGLLATWPRLKHNEE